MMTCNTPYLTDLPGVATESGEWAALCTDDARAALRWCQEHDRPGIAWRYFNAPQPAEVADRIRQTNERRTHEYWAWLAAELERPL